MKDAMMENVTPQRPSGAQLEQSVDLVLHELRAHGQRSSRDLLCAFYAAGGQAKARSFLHWQMLAATSGSAPFGYSGAWVLSDASRQVKLARRLVIKTPAEKILTEVLRCNLTINGAQLHALQAIQGDGDPRLLAEARADNSLAGLATHLTGRPRLTLKGRVCLDVYEAIVAERDQRTG